ncbi:unnamed protein product [Phaeothamnion confervicola]
MTRERQKRSRNVKRSEHDRQRRTLEHLKTQALESHGYYEVHELLQDVTATRLENKLLRMRLGEGLESEEARDWASMKRAEHASKAAAAQLVNALLGKDIIGEHQQMVEANERLRSRIAQLELMNLTLQRERDAARRASLRSRKELLAKVKEIKAQTGGASCVIQ